MKTLILLAATLILTPPILADDANPEGLSKVQQLGKLNGVALVCNQMALVSRARTVMVNHVPKTRQYGAAYEEATNAAYLEAGQKGTRCPDGKELAQQMAQIGEELKAIFPQRP